MRPVGVRGIASRLANATRLDRRICDALLATHRPASDCYQQMRRAQGPGTIISKWFTRTPFGCAYPARDKALRRQIREMTYEQRVDLAKALRVNRPLLDEIYVAPSARAMLEDLQDLIEELSPAGLSAELNDATITTTIRLTSRLGKTARAQRKLRSEGQLSEVALNGAVSGAASTALAKLFDLISSLANGA